MPNVKQVILKDPKTGQYLSPKVYGALTYEPAPDGGGSVPPYEGAVNEDMLNAALETKADVNHTHTVSQITDMPDLANMVPSGIICMWSGESTAIPSGWHLCDGDAGTPDLRDRFIVGAGSTYKVKDTGGEATHTLTTNEMPSHSHSFSGSATSAGAHNHTATLSLSGLTTNSAGEHTHTYPYYDHNTSPYRVDGLDSNNRTATGYKNTSSAGGHTHTISGSGSVSIATGGAHTHTVTGTIGNTGSGQAHENRPPYFALCFIMKL